MQVKKALKGNYGIAIKGKKYGFGLGLMQYPWSKAIRGKQKFWPTLLCFEPFCYFKEVRFQIRYMWFTIIFIYPYR